MTNETDAKNAVLNLIGKKIVAIKQSGNSSFSVHLILDDGTNIHIPTDEFGFDINEIKDIGAPIFRIGEQIFDILEEE